MQILYILIVLVVIWLVFGKFYRKQDGIFSSIVFTIEVSLIVWLNIPLLVTIPDEVVFNSWFAEFPFNLYKNFGLAYTFICNILLIVIGAAASNVMSRKVQYCSKKTINKCFNRFIENATSLKIIGKDLDFLLRKDCKRQKDRILELKDQVEILCSNPYLSNGQIDDKTMRLIELYNDLSKSGNKIRFYNNNEGIKNLLGQIKVDNQKKESGLFVHKLGIDTEESFGGKSKFAYEKHINGYLLEGVTNKFNETFSRGLNPIVKFIALDVGGVYLNGDIDTFIDYLLQTYGIRVPRKLTDRFDLNKDLSIGKISILECIKNLCKKSSRKKFEDLSQSDKNEILNKWKKTWEKDKNTYSLIEKIISLGYEVIPFSNVDKDNGEMYLRDNYFPIGCRYHVFSYKEGVSKSDGSLFDRFTAKVNDIINSHKENKESLLNVKGCQILLIDDRQENISAAETRGWQTIQFDRNNQSIDNLVMLLKEKSILPQDFRLD